MDGRTNGRMDGLTSGWRCIYVYACVKECMGGWLDGCRAEAVAVLYRG